MPALLHDLLYEHPRDLRVELQPRLVPDLIDSGLTAYRGTVRPVGGHGVERLRDGDDPRLQGYLFPKQSQRIAGSVPMLVVVQDIGRQLGVFWYLAEDVVADLGMPLYLIHLSFLQRVPVVQDLVVEMYLPDVVQGPGLEYLVCLRFGEPHAQSDRFAQRGDIPAVVPFPPGLLEDGLHHPLDDMGLHLRGVRELLPVHLRLGTPEQLAPSHPLVGALHAAERGRKRDARDGVGPEAGVDLPDYRERLAQGRARHQYHELVAADPDHPVGRPALLLHRQCEPDDRLVPFRMAERVVDELQPVDVREHERELAGVLQLVGQHGLVVPAVVQARELVADRVVVYLPEHVVVRLGEPLLDDHDPHEQVGEDLQQMPEGVHRPVHILVDGEAQLGGRQGHERASDIENDPLGVDDLQLPDNHERDGRDSHDGVLNGLLECRDADTIHVAGGEIPSEYERPDKSRDNDEQRLLQTLAERVAMEERDDAQRSYLQHPSCDPQLGGHVRRRPRYEVHPPVCQRVHTIEHRDEEERQAEEIEHIVL